MFLVITHNHLLPIFAVFCYHIIVERTNGRTDEETRRVSSSVRPSVSLMEFDTYDRFAQILGFVFVSWT